jgi:hypothetical protein
VSNIIRKKSILLGVIFLVLVAGATLWSCRAAVVTRMVRHELARQGFADADFTIRTLSPGHVVVEDIRVGMPVPSLTIDRVDVRFSIREVLRRRIERVTVRGVRTQVTVDGGKVTSPLYERVRPLLESQPKEAPAGPSANARFVLGAASLQDLQVSVFQVGGPRLGSQEEAPLLTLCGTARFHQTATNQWLTATMDADMSGRSMLQVLSQGLPSVSGLFLQGGTIHAEAELGRRPPALWSGQASFEAETLHPSVLLANGRAGAGALRVTGSTEIVDDKPGVVRVDGRMEGGQIQLRDLSLEGGADVTLTCLPPYTSASGVFKGRMSEPDSQPQPQTLFQDRAVPFEGEIVVSGLNSNPAGQVSLRVPDFGLSFAQEGVNVQATAGAEATLRGSATSVSAEGGAWLREVSARIESGGEGVGEAGVGRLSAQVKVPAFNPTLASNAAVGVTVNLSNGWARAGSSAVLEDVRGAVPLAWSPAKGLSFLPEQSLTWRRLEVQGLKVEPDAFALSAGASNVTARLGAHVTGSRLGVVLAASVPLDDPRQMVIDVTLPEAEIAAGDALAEWVRQKAEGTEVSGRVSAEAHVRFLGSQPHVLGRVKLAEGLVRSGNLEVEGIAADVPFESGVFFRTIERPLVSFKRAKAGNVRTDQGRLAFQLTEQELFVDRMEVGWCKGSLDAYSVHLNLKNPKDEFIVYADRIDLGEALMMLFPVKGQIQGVLYGRFPVGFDNGHVKLSTGFLYSLPGQGGTLKLDDPSQMAALLEKAGIQGSVQAPLSRALSDLNFSTFRMDLEQGKGDEGTLRITLGGKSNDKEWPAPVDLNLNLHGPLEELLNMGLDVSRK